ncbi:MAG: integrase arm-type DNA-binding domain-containing protein [Pseudomonadota bacterium]
MATTALTESACKSALPKEKDYKLAGGYGMYLFVTRSGGKIFRMNYKIDGKFKTIVLGPYPLLSLRAAEKKRDEVRLKLVNKVDPQPKEVVKEAISFTQLLDLYMRHKASGGLFTPKYLLNIRNGLAMHVGNYLGERNFASITRADLLGALMNLNSANKFSYARKIRMWCVGLWEWAMELGYCVSNPAAMINPNVAFGAKPVKGFAALRLSEVPEFLRRLQNERLQTSVFACRMLALTWVRTEELRQMKWEHIEGDLWRVPASQMKGEADSKREHLVPLPAQALQLLEVIKPYSRNSLFVFASDRDIKRPMTQNCVLDLIKRMGYQQRMTGHGWRKVGSTWANEQVNGDGIRKYDPDWIEMQLAHQDGSVRGIYNSAEYLQPRRLMLQDYADWLDKANEGL